MPFASSANTAARQVVWHSNHRLHQITTESEGDVTGDLELVLRTVRSIFRDQSR
ncbi:hypothetical protein F750_6413 [Streptomyces sp. PAMC 26508]|nr:hypothetical protein F750_6413 [Streptomyces sp. PAMC 26508]